VTEAGAPHGRRATAAAGVYASTALGILASLVVFRVLGPADAGRFVLVLGTVDFVSTLLWLTSDEALVKYGFRYTANEDWGRLRRLVIAAFRYELVVSLAASAIVVVLAPLVGLIFNDAEGLQTAMLIAALLPPLQALDSIGGAVLILRGRYDVRGLLLTLSMGLRLAGVAVGAQFGVTWTIVAVVAAQAVTSAVVVAFAVGALRRFPAAAPARLAEDRRPILRFVLQSSIYTGFVSLRTWVAPLVLGMVSTPANVGLFRAAQTPQQGFAVLLAPVRLILLTEQTRDWEHGRPEVVFAGLRRFVIGSTVLMAIVVPPVLWLMPWLLRLLFGEAYEPATDAARLVLIAGAIQLVLGWTKSFAVTIGRPGLRTVAHAVEAAVLLPLIVVLGETWGVTGAGGAVLASTVAFAVTWGVLIVRLRRAGLGPETTATATG
jgi:O-antigen/teichoic acid export membrane protein